MLPLLALSTGVVRWRNAGFAAAFTLKGKVFMKEIHVQTVGKVQVTIDKIRKGNYLVMVVSGGIILEMVAETPSRKEAFMAKDAAVSRWRRKTKREISLLV